MKQLNDMKYKLQNYKIESQQYKTQVIDIEQLNNKFKSTITI